MRQYEGRLLFEVSGSGHVVVAVEERGLRMRGPFGELLIPYDGIHHVARGAGGGLRVDGVAVRFWLDLSDLSDRMALFRLLEEKIKAARSAG